VAGGLREDEFSGGFALRARRCWDYAQLCAQHAERLSVRLDLREPGSLERFRDVLERHAGATPLLLEAITETAVGQLQINGGQGVRVDADLPGLLRSLPGVRTVRLALARPWLH
jgi:DNA polymerase III subunit alpha